MTKLLNVALSLMLALTAFSAQAADGSWEEGRHYERLSNPVRTSNPDVIEVAEVFWYGCGHCYRFKPLVEAWADKQAENVSFEMVPAALGRSWTPHAMAFYALKAIDQLNDTTNDALFKALAVERRALNDADALGEFLSDYGVDKAEFVAAYESFGVSAQFQQAQSQIRGARITGTPTMLVNGKYTVTGTGAGSHEAMLEVVDYLVAKERDAR
ncbi:thiol:disulfide interchange protein DsbA/DsbL [Marinobacter sp. CA1]|uniref:thiol:disulfide interchange protein DsbA/DsbL n=1 Tax=Marinobacter sp. CA1 TaxID=2817656 RepID=UPI001D0877ED|nr:thiol:disulfide interchange protein DsbA/DsbL [Marinobacter sp. CA1]UDL05573.1 thiol:disulfide interchange protein DsbA/DsbL [Marinobacter sp. CA1]